MVINSRFMNLSFQLFEKLIKIGYIFFITYLLTENLTVDAFGELNFYLTLVTIGIGVCQFGMESTITLRLTKCNKANERKELILTSFVLRLFCSTVYCIFIFGITYIFSMGDSSQYLLLMPIVLFLSCFNVIDYKLISEELGKIILRVRTASYVVTLTTIFCLLKIELEEFIAFYLIVEYLIVAFILIIYYVHSERFDNIEWKILDKVKLTVLIKDSFPLFISSIGILLYMRLDIVMLSFLAGFDDVANYSLAVRFSEALNFLPVVIMTSMYPFLANNNKIEIFKRFFESMMLLSVAVIIGVYIFYPIIVDYFFGSDYSDSILIAYILVLQSIPVFLGIVRAKYLVINNLQRYIPYFVFSGLTINIFANFILISIWGAIGAAVATLISQVFTTLIIPYYFKDLRGVTKLMINSVLTCGFSLFFSKRTEV